jgi:glutamate--cysteine ligase
MQHLRPAPVHTSSRSPGEGFQPCADNSTFHAGEVATLEDWESHLTTIFPEVRLKRFLEMRGADGGPWSMICALPALWVGLLYTKGSQARCLELIADWTLDEMDYLRATVCIQWKLPIRICCFALVISMPHACACLSTAS